MTSARGAKQPDELQRRLAAVKSSGWKAREGWLEIRADLSSLNLSSVDQVNKVTTFISTRAETARGFSLALDLSDNGLTDECVEALVKWMTSFGNRLLLRSLKLYKNR